jgi:hypothetical protein
VWCSFRIQGIGCMSSRACGRSRVLQSTPPRATLVAQSISDRFASTSTKPTALEGLLQHGNYIAPPKQGQTFNIPKYGIWAFDSSVFCHLGVAGRGRKLEFIGYFGIAAVRRLWRLNCNPYIRKRYWLLSYLRSRGLEPAERSISDSKREMHPTQVLTGIRRFYSVGSSSMREPF